MQLYRYSDERYNYERCALVINSKLHWLDIQDFTLEDLKPQLEMVGISVNTKNELWGIFHGLVATSCIDFYVVDYDRKSIDINTLATSSHKNISLNMSGDSVWWDISSIADDYELGEIDDDDE